MSLFDVFKHKKEKPVEADKKEATKKPVKKSIKKAPVKTAPVKTASIKKAKTGMAYKSLESPHVTEKASLLIEENKYTFKVASRTNKIEIKKSVEDLYGVDVVNVSVINVHRKKRRVGRKFGFKKGYKKAIVEIKKGQKIEIMPR